MVTGGAGQLGTALARHAWPDGWEAVPLARAALDLGDPAAIAAAVASRRWAAVINAGAYTAVDRAEDEPAAAWAVNALAPAALAHACQAGGVPLVHVSTDYVFSGDRQDAWEVDDATLPRGVYGASKLGGEWAVRTACARHAIVRTAWLVSATGHNFVRTMVCLAAERDRIRVVADQHGSPTAAADLAAALAIVAMGLADGAPAAIGTFHFVNRGATSWAGFADAILAGSARRGGPVATVEPIATADHPGRAPRPANSVLATGGIERAFGIVPRPWEDALAPILDDLLGAPR